MRIIDTFSSQSKSFSWSAKVFRSYMITVCCFVQLLYIPYTGWFCCRLYTAASCIGMILCPNVCLSFRLGFRLIVSRVSGWKVFASLRPRESKYRFRQALAHTCSIHTQCALAKTIEWIEKCLFCECSLCLLSLYCLYVANVVGFVSAAPSNGTRPTRMRAKERPSVGNIAGVCLRSKTLRS